VFRRFVNAGQRLADLHVNYERQPDATLPTPSSSRPEPRSGGVEGPAFLDWLENPHAKLSYRVEKMKLSKDKNSLSYNEYWTLANIPAEVYEYRLGNRSALEWVVDQY